MELTILQMQALEYVLHVHRNELQPIFRDAKGKIWTGHFFDFSGQTAKYWHRSPSGNLTLIELTDLPQLFAGWLRKTEVNSFEGGHPLQVFDQIQTLSNTATNDFTEPTAFMNNPTTDFSAEPFVFDFNNGAAKLPFVELTADSYEFISLTYQ